MSRNKRQRADGEEQQMWNEIFDSLKQIYGNESKSKDIIKTIIEMEKQIKVAITAAGGKASIEPIDALGQKYREGVKLAEDTKSLDLPELISKLEILKAMVEHREVKNQTTTTRTFNPRDSQTAMDFDGPSDSPVPSPAENKHFRKAVAGRTSSQPPRDKDSIKEEKEERVKDGSSTGRTKIVFENGEEVAFKPKSSNQTQESDWIQGVVVKIIGEGKSRRYDVRDAEPDEDGKTVTYRSSASSMVPVPPEGTLLQDYEVGKRVLALYPDTTTFYRAEVKAMLDDGKKVQVLFEEESLEHVKTVTRRYVLDHKG